jgi:hypothetical protein
MRALEPAWLRRGWIRKGKRRRDFGPSKATRRGSARGFTASAVTHRDRTGREPRSGTGESEGLHGSSDPKAAQREMASPPSDGSQSWDKWGPVATPAPITIPGVALSPALAHLALSLRGGDRIFLREGAKAQRREAFVSNLDPEAGVTSAEGASRRGWLRAFAPLRLLSKMGSHGVGYRSLIPPPLVS